MDSASNLPMSPWADRYRDTQLTITEDGMKHSLLAPRYPELKDPKYYDQDPDPKEAHPPTNNKDIDRLLWSETLQKVRLGLRTYQLTVLNRRLMFPTSDGLRPMPGGHRQTSQLHLSRPLGIRKLSGSGKVSGLRKFNFQDFWFSSGSYGSLADSLRPDFQTYKQERIKVDQNTWLPFLRKDRWFDWHSYSLMEPTQPTQPTVTWSVDDEELWSGLSVVLELVNRILLALLIEKHDSGKKTLLYLKSNQNLIFMVVILRTMIFGRWDFWDNLEDVFGPPPSEDATVLLSYEKEQVVCNKRGTNVCEFKQTVDKTVPEARDRLILLLSKLIWTFTDTYDCIAFTSGEPSGGPKDDPYTSVISISTTAVQVLCNPDLTVDELCNIQVYLAITIIHEIMHAILGARYFDDNYIGNCIDEEKDDRDYRPGATREPYLDAEGMHEAGWYMEQSIFGGVVDLVPMADDTRTVCPPLILYFTQWPHIFEKDKFKPADSKSAYLQDGAKYLKYHTPSTWSSKLLSETFWNSPAFPRKSDNFFHNPRLFYTEATVQGDKLQEKSNGRLHAIQISDEPDQPENQYPETREILNDWNNQVDLWTQMRVPWYGNVANIWRNTPWSGISRLKLLSFANAFAKKSHVQCAVIATSLLETIPWANGHDAYIKQLTQKNKAGYINPKWAWHAIGLLMLASLPLRTEELVETLPNPRWILEFIPSKDAAIAGHHWTVYTTPVRDKRSQKADVSVLYDQTKPDGGKVNDFTQLDYLALITSIIGLIAQFEGTLQVDILAAIVHAREALLKDRQRLVRDYAAGHSARWASEWPFKFPEYNPKRCTWKEQRWVEE